MDKRLNILKLGAAGKLGLCRMLALAWVTGLAACTSHISEDLDTAALAKSGDAVILLTAVIDRNQEMSCMSVSLRTLDDKMPRTVGGRLVSMVKLGSGTIMDPSAEVTGSTQIAPGTYKIADVSCKRPNKSGTLVILSDSPKGFATFSVAAGEVVNLGKLIIIEVEAESSSFMHDARYVYVSYVVPLKRDPRPLLNKDLAAQLVDRSMTPTSQALPQAELARICKQRLAAPGIRLGTGRPTTCTLAGL